MKEEDSNWFAKWEEQLPSPQELTPLSQSLITPHLAQAFDITPHHHHHQTPPQPNSSPEFESETGGTGGGGDDQARTLKRPRLVWTPQLHKRFVDAVAHLGIKNAVPKTIMQLMSVDGLTRENVASHLQKYRLYLKRMQENHTNSKGNGTGNVSVDSAMDRLFASAPVPAHFLRQNSDHFVPYVPVAAMPREHHHHGQVTIVGQQFGQINNPTRNGQFEQHQFVLARQQTQFQRMGPNNSNNPMMSSGTAANGKKVLTLFPTGKD